jgi:hypothetical protein
MRILSRSGAGNPAPPSQGVTVTALAPADAAEAAAASCVSAIGGGGGDAGGCCAEDEAAAAEAELEDAGVSSAGTTEHAAGTGPTRQPAPPLPLGSSSSGTGGVLDFDMS